MNSIYHTELLAPSAVPFPVCGECPTGVRKVDISPSFSTKDDLKYRKPSKAEESLRAKIMPSICSSLLKLIGPPVSCGRVEKGIMNLLATKTSVLSAYPRSAFSQKMLRFNGLLYNLLHFSSPNDGSKGGTESVSPYGG